MSVATDELTTILRLCKAFAGRLGALFASTSPSLLSPREASCQDGVLFPAEQHPGLFRPEQRRREAPAILPKVDEAVRCKPRGHGHEQDRAFLRRTWNRHAAVGGAGIGPG